jgi:phosphoglycerol transferase MdoB-like AlkP superfamily enzyme
VGPPTQVASTWAAELSRSGVPAQVLADGRLRSSVAPDPGGAGPRNIVVVVEESLGANHVSALRAEQELTPNLDAIASQGLLFTEAFATGTRTVRGLEALTLSFPPLPGESVVRRPGSVGIANWGEQLRLQGYDTSFLYGGYAYFDDMEEFFAGNGFTVSDRTEIDNPRFANIWGVSDEDLFDHAVSWFDARAAEGKPFFSVVLTTSNHKPFTFRPGVPGVPEEGGGRLAGVRYADFALGGFLDEAREHSWFDDTLFVLLGDHGARVYGATQIPVESYRIPVVFYAPAFVPPERSAVRLSQIDVMPTVFGLLGLGWEGPFFGRDAFKDERTPRPIPLNHNYAVGLLEGDRLALLDFGKVAEVVTWNEDSGGYEAREPDPEQLATAVALFETADHLYRNDLWH